MTDLPTMLNIHIAQSTDKEVLESGIGLSWPEHLERSILLLSACSTLAQASSVSLSFPLWYIYPLI